MSVFLAVLLLAVSSVPAFSQTEPTRGWIAINVARFQPAQDDLTFTFVTSLFGETAAAAASYPKLDGLTGFDVSGGFGIRRGLGVGLRFDATKHESVVGLGVVIPSPFFFNTPGIDSAVTDAALERRERSLDIQAVYTLPASDRVIVRVFGGPTYFHVTSDMVEIIRYNQLASAIFRINVVDITTITQREVSGSAFGFNVGGDLSVFFTRNVGVGGVVRFNNGTVTMREPLTARDEDFKVGRAVFGGGLRLRF